MRLKKYLLPVICALLLSACHHDREVKRSVYFWRTIFKLSDVEKNFLKDNQINTIYLRCFDVGQDIATGLPKPQATVMLQENFPEKTMCIPVIYIKNEVMKQLNGNSTDELAVHLLQLCDKLLEQRKIEYKELQIDCDWTDTSRKNYFALIKSIRNKIHLKEKLLSVTIRLHQVKYKNKTGIPPADKGMLMFYNMGNLNNPNTINSIYDSSTAVGYINSVKDYNLPLDAAIPIFTWAVQIRDHRPIKLLNSLQEKNIRESGFFKLIGHNYYVTEKGFFFREIYFQPGDLLRLEEITPSLSIKASKQLAAELNRSSFHVALYHLDESNTSRYETQDINEIYNCFK